MVKRKSSGRARLGCDLVREPLPSPRPVLHEEQDGHDSTRRDTAFVFVLPHLSPRSFEELIGLIYRLILLFY